MTFFRKPEPKRLTLVSAQIRYGGNSGLRGATPCFSPEEFRKVLRKMGHNQNIFKVVMTFQDDAGVPFNVTLRDLGEDGWTVYGGSLGDESTLLPTFEEVGASVLHPPETKSDKEVFEELGFTCIQTR